MAGPSREERREAAIRYARRSRLEQGFPEKVTDPVALRKIAAILNSASRRAS